MMQINQQDFDLLQQIAELSINDQTSRQSGLIDIVQMQWNIPSCTLSVQYKHLYISRMQKLEKRLNRPGIVSIAQVTQKNQKYTIRGIIKRLEHERVRAFQKQFKQKYNNDKPIYTLDDELQIQDNSGKLKLNIGEITLENHMTIKNTDLPYGVQVILQGKFRKSANKFQVKNIIFPSIAPQQLYFKNYINKDGVSFQNKQILVLSQPTIEQLMNLKIILKNTFSMYIRQITAIIIIGGFEAKIQEINEMAAFITELKDSIDIFIMPSSNADRRRLFPLQPLSGIYFPKSFKEIGMCSNPQIFKGQNGLNIHISCGQNALDFIKNGSLAETSLQVLQNFIRFSHYAPTSPFSLKTQPYSQDYLVMQELPHVMIVGKSKEFASKTLNIDGGEVLLVSIERNGMGLISLNGSKACKFH